MSPVHGFPGRGSEGTVESYTEHSFGISQSSLALIWCRGIATLSERGVIASFALHNANYAISFNLHRPFGFPNYSDGSLYPVDYHKTK